MLKYKKKKVKKEKLILKIIDFNKDNLKSSSYKRNKRKDELLKSPYNSNINGSENENYKPGTYKGRKKFGDK